jgi:hypothetical protein
MHLAHFRVMQRLQDLGGSPEPRFCVCLTRSIGGDGKNRTDTVLYFSYKVKFYEFDRIAQDALQLSYINPDVHSPPAGLTTSETFPPETSTSSSSKERDLVSSSMPTMEVDSTYSEFGTTWVRKALPRSRAEKGYSVRDGPWRCRIAYNKPSAPSSTEPHLISDEESFNRLIARIEVYNKLNPGAPNLLMVMHVSFLSRRNGFMFVLTGTSQRTENSGIDG